MIGGESDAEIARDAFLELLGVTHEHAHVGPEDFRIAYENHPEQMYAIFGGGEEGVSRMGSYEDEEEHNEQGELSKSLSLDQTVKDSRNPDPCVLAWCAVLVQFIVRW